MPLAVSPSPQSMVMSDPLTGNRMVSSSSAVVQVVTKAWSGASRRGSMGSAAMTWTIWWWPPPNR